jgi:hypothetical protein
MNNERKPFGLKGFKEAQRKSAEASRRSSAFWGKAKELGIPELYVPNRPYTGRSSGTVGLEKPGK